MFPVLPRLFPFLKWFSFQLFTFFPVIYAQRTHSPFLHMSVPQSVNPSAAWLNTSILMKFPDCLINHAFSYHLPAVLFRISQNLQTVEGCCPRSLLRFRTVLHCLTVLLLPFCFPFFAPTRRQALYAVFAAPPVARS